jgi:S-DNA-T family DNA segregation ATPase FtsK/SpoIIIE
MIKKLRHGRTKAAKVLEELESLGIIDKNWNIVSPPTQSDGSNSNGKRALVHLRDILESPEWKNDTQQLSFIIGRDINGQVVIGDLARTYQILMAGRTGSGKSVMIHTMIASLLQRNTPNDLRLVLCDIKGNEMNYWADIPHLLTPIATEPEKILEVLRWVISEIERRYQCFADAKVMRFTHYNKKCGNNKKMPYIVVVVDEYADLVLGFGRDAEALIVRIAQKCKGAGVYLIISTGLAKNKTIPGIIKANMGTRIAFSVHNPIESRIILNQVGAEKLLGKGDMLFYPCYLREPKRVQVAYATDDEMIDMADVLRQQASPKYAFIPKLPKRCEPEIDLDEYKQAVRLVFDEDRAAAALLQRKMRIGYCKASRLIDEMEKDGIVGPMKENEPRDVLITKKDLIRKEREWKKSK